MKMLGGHIYREALALALERDLNLAINRKGDSFAREIRHFLDSIQTGKAPSIPAIDGLNVQKMLNGIYDSAKAGREIHL